MEIKVSWPFGDPDYLRLFLISFGCLAAGVVIGAIAIKVLGMDSLAGLTDYFNASVAGLAQGSAVSSQVAWLALRNNLVVLILIWFLGLTVIGTPLILLAMAARGFALGFTVAFLVETKAFQGVLMALLAVLPQNIFSLPVLLAASVAAVSFCRSLLASRGNVFAPLGQRLLSYVGMLGLFLPVLVVASLIEAYISPWAIRVVVAYF